MSGIRASVTGIPNDTQKVYWSPPVLGGRLFVLPGARLEHCSQEGVCPCTDELFGYASTVISTGLQEGEPTEPLFLLVLLILNNYD